jgi:hypothetical protein
LPRRIEIGDDRPLNATVRTGDHHGNETGRCRRQLEVSRLGHRGGSLHWCQLSRSSVRAAWPAASPPGSTHTVIRTCADLRQEGQQGRFSPSAVEEGALNFWYRMGREESQKAQPSHLAQLQSPVLRLPVVKGMGADTMPAAEIGGRSPASCSRRIWRICSSM